MKDNSDTRFCVACKVRLENCVCEAGMHIYGDQHNITFEDNCPQNCPAFKFVDGKYIRRTEKELELRYN